MQDEPPWDAITVKTAPRLPTQRNLPAVEDSQGWKWALLAALVVTFSVAAWALPGVLE